MSKEEEKLREQIAILLRKNALSLAVSSSPYKSEKVADQILIIIAEENRSEVAEAIQKLQALKEWVGVEFPEIQRRIEEIREALEK